MIPQFLFEQVPARTQKSFAAWLRPAYGEFTLDYDVDRIDALAGERQKEWTRLGSISRAGKVIFCATERTPLFDNSTPSRSTPAFPNPATCAGNRHLIRHMKASS